MVVGAPQAAWGAHPSTGVWRACAEKVPPVGVADRVQQEAVVPLWARGPEHGPRLCLRVKGRAARVAAELLREAQADEVVGLPQADGPQHGDLQAAALGGVARPRGGWQRRRRDRMGHRALFGNMSSPKMKAAPWGMRCGLGTHNFT